jgi:hypothetical protein
MKYKYEEDVSADKQGGYQDYETPGVEEWFAGNHREGDEPMEIDMNNAKVLYGIYECVRLMARGQKSRCTIPPHYAYGGEGIEAGMASAD